MRQRGPRPVAASVVVIGHTGYPKTITISNSTITDPKEKSDDGRTKRPWRAKSSPSGLLVTPPSDSPVFQTASCCEISDFWPDFAWHCNCLGLPYARSSEDRLALTSDARKFETRVVGAGLPFSSPTRRQLSQKRRRGIGFGRN